MWTTFGSIDNISKSLYLRNLIINVCCVLVFSLVACNKLVQIDQPVNTITTVQTFSDSANAASAVMGIYTKMNGANISVGNSSLTLYSGGSSDELLFFGSTGESQIMYNTLLANDGYTSNFFWSPAYQYIYQTNAIIEGLSASTTISQRVKNKFTGEAKFFRAFLHFYLVNLFGDIPIAATTDYKSEAIAARSSTEDVYNFIIADLQDAQDLLPDNYSAGLGERIRANKWAATALLARVYLYTKDYAKAEEQASLIINNTATFSLNQDLLNVFLKNNSEAILQWQLNTEYSPYTATIDGRQIIPPVSTKRPGFYLNKDLLNAFEPNDQRKTDWVDSTIYQGKVYYYPYKYKVGPSQAVVGGDPAEYLMVLRLAEQYLIRAEARARLSEPGAIADINVLRERANLPDLADTMTQSEALTAIAHERRIELFAEWGHRWLDLKRTGAIDSIMTIATPLKGGGSAWHSYQQLYPIPAAEIMKDPYLTQNQGY